MTETSPLVAALVVGLGLAFVFGTLAQRLKLPPLAGYLIAGVVVGPFTPGVVADPRLTLELADIGVILLMFGVGLHFSPRDLWAVRKIAVPGAVLQMVLIAALGLGAGRLFGWTVAQSLMFGLCLSVASTVVVLRALSDRHLMDSERGRIAIGWLVAQDLLTVLVLVVLPPLAGALKGGGLDGTALMESMGITFGKLALFLALIFAVGAKAIPAILHYIAHTGSRELFRLAVLSVALGVAYVSAELFGVSIALGAFLAGMILSGSPLSQRAAEESLPLRDAFAVLFFVSVGMLFDPVVLLREPLRLAATLGVVLAGGAIAFLLLRLLGVSKRAALIIAVSLAQIGEFSFILADLGTGLGLLPQGGRDLILGASILAILLNPLFFALTGHDEKDVVGDIPARPPLTPTRLEGHVVLVGYGRVGSLIADGLKRGGVPFVVVEDRAGANERLVQAGIEHIAGNAAEAEVLFAANIAGARLLLVAIPESFEAGQIVEQARAVNPGLRIIARAHFDAEVGHLLAHGADQVVMGERETALAMLGLAGVASAGS